MFNNDILKKELETVDRREANTNHKYASISNLLENEDKVKEFSSMFF